MPTDDKGMHLRRALQRQKLVHRIRECLRELNEGK